MQDSALASADESDLPVQPSATALGKRRAISSEDDAAATKRTRTSTSPAHTFSAMPEPSTSRVIVPSLPKSRSPSPQNQETSDDEDDQEAQQAPVAKHEPVLSETYTVLPPAERITPATSAEELLDRRQQPYRRSRPSMNASQVDNVADELEEEDGQHYRPGFSLPTAEAGPSNPQASTSAIVDLTEAPSPPLSTSSRASSSSLPPAPPVNKHGAGSSTTSAILIQDSPTPPLRPLADPQARLEASASGRCGVLGNEPSPEKEEEKVTLGQLVCPICLGPPTPFVLTECGHAFCGPCLHSALISQPITQQTLRDLPNIGEKELEGTCPVCRHPLAGGWGKALRGAVLRMAEVEVPC